ncbi:MAG: hypothetical protein ACOY3I_07690 [Verrucomicrobiota bacterium]
MTAHGHHSPLHNMSPSCHHILDLKKLHFFHFDVWQTDYIRHFEPILPPDWRVVAVEPDTVPHGRMADLNEQHGVMMTFMGTTIVQHRRGDIKNYEGFILWMMPLPYSGRLMPDFAHLPSHPLGYTHTHAIYEYQLSTSVPTWTHWKQELTKLLRLAPLPPDTQSWSERII